MSYSCKYRLLSFLEVWSWWNWLQDHEKSPPTKGENSNQKFGRMDQRWPLELCCQRFLRCKNTTTKGNWKNFKFQDWNRTLPFGWSYERWRVAATPRAPETLAWKGSASTVSVASIHRWICRVATIPTCTIWRARQGRETAVGKTWSWLWLLLDPIYP